MSAPEINKQNSPIGPQRFEPEAPSGSFAPPLENIAKTPLASLSVNIRTTHPIPVPHRVLPIAEAAQLTEARVNIIKAAVSLIKKPPRHTTELLEALCKNQSADLSKDPLYPFFLKKYAEGRENFLAAIQRMLRKNPHDRAIQKIGTKLAALCIESIKIKNALKQGRPFPFDIQKALLSSSQPHVLADMLKSHFKENQMPVELKAILEIFKELGTTLPKLTTEEIELYCQTMLAVQEALKDQKTHIAELKLKQLKNNNSNAFQLLWNRIENDLKNKDPAQLDKLKGLINQKEEESVKQALELSIPIELIVSSIAADSPIRQRFFQLLQGIGANEFEIHKVASSTKLSSREAITLAYFIEMTLKIKNKTNEYFRAQDHGLSRDVQVDWKAKEVYIISESRSSQLQAQGTYKKALSAIAIPFADRRKELVEQVVQLSPVGPTPEIAGKTPQVDLGDITSELPFYQTLQDSHNPIPGIAKLRSVTNLTTLFQGTSRPQKSISLIFNRADKGTLSEAMRKGPWPPERQNKIGKQLIHNFAMIHAKGVFHGDVKPANILIDAKDQVFVTDFGMAHFLKNGKPNHCLQEDNAYAAWWYTPLDMLRDDPQQAVPERGAEDYKKIESWAVGCMLFEMAFGRPAWIEKSQAAGWPPQKYDQATGKNSLSEDDLAKMEDEYHKKVQEPLQKLIQIPENVRTQEQHYQFAMLKLLDKVENRWTLEQADSYMSKSLPHIPKETAS